LFDLAKDRKQTVDIKKEKAVLREKMLAVRAAMSASAHQEANRRIFESVCALEEYQRANTVFVYVGVADEPDTIALIEDAWQRGKRVCVPHCVSLGVMDAYAIEDLDDLQPGKYGIPEPKEGCQLVLSHEIDLTIVPCVCCSKDGYRLGYGGGFYDRWLAEQKAPAAVLCYAELLVSDVPHEPHDQKVNIVISDAAAQTLKE